MQKDDYTLPMIVGDEREECLNKIIIRGEVFDDEYHWPNLCRFLDANKHLFNNPYFTKAQTIKEFSGRTIPFKLLDSQNETRYTFKSYMNLVRFLVQQLIHNHFGEMHFPDNTELTRWETGRSMGVHSDIGQRGALSNIQVEGILRGSDIYLSNKNYTTQMGRM